MIDILRKPYDNDVFIICDGENTDATLRTEVIDDKLYVWLKADKSHPKFVHIRWNLPMRNIPVKLMGDTWERSYGDLCWGPLSSDRFFPWYFMADDGYEIRGYGVMVRPNSFVSFEYDAKGVSAWFDVRCGTRGVELGGRELHIGTVVCKGYTGMTAFEAAKEFCKVMSPNPVLPKKPVYGSNNWYYAYGKSSGEEIRRDADIIAQLTEGNENRPFMVIDDGWTPNPCAGPWMPNESFGDMKQIADDFKNMGVQPGIWIRPLHDVELEKEHPEYILHNGVNVLDPSRPEVKEYVKETVSRISSWGYELLKHDYTTHDIFAGQGFYRNGMITGHGDWSFFDKSKTSAEIVLELYKTIREAANGMMILGCNTISHLCAGLVEINRIGDDTSGKTWSRTRAMGVNTLAFRLPQNGSFYIADADCVGIKGNNIPWKLNKQWLRLLAYSGTPLFISCEPDALTDNIKADLTRFLSVNSVQEDTAVPIDWQYNVTPNRWLINGELTEFDWIVDSYPLLLDTKELPN